MAANKSSDIHPTVGRSTGDSMPSFRTICQHYIKMNGWNQKEFAKQVGCSDSFVSNVMKDKSGLSEGMAQRWATALGIEGEAELFFIDLALLQNLPHSARSRILDALNAARPLRQVFRDFDGDLQ